MGKKISYSIYISDLHYLHLIMSCLLCSLDN